MRAGERIAVAIVLDEAEGGDKPFDGAGKIVVGNVRKHGIDGDGAVCQHRPKIRLPGMCGKEPHKLLAVGGCDLR